MHYISLFAGIGGFDLALDKLGFECVYANDFDKYCKQIYDHNFKQPLDSRSITVVPTGDIPDHDLLVGGFPCQAFSVAGRRLGFADTRGTLFFDVARILKDKRPRYFILENVKGLLSHDNGKTFATILGVLADLGYGVQWQVLNSKNFGVPQSRERVFIVGHLRGAGRPQIFPLRSISFSYDANRTIRAGGRGSTSEKHRWDIVQVNDPIHSNDRVYDPKGISPTLNTMQGGRRQPFVAMRWIRTEKGKEARRAAQRAGRDYTPFSNGHRTLTPSNSDVVGTITSQSISKDSLLGSGIRIRRLTPRECERLQGFPDDWTKYGILNGKVIEISDTQRYKTLGNAVTTNVVYEVAKRMFEK